MATMSRAIDNQPQNQTWGPNNQQMNPPWQYKHSPIWKVIGWSLGAMWLHAAIDPTGRDQFMWCLKVMIYGWVAKWLIRGIRDERIPIDWLVRLGEQAAWGLATLFIQVAPRNIIRPIARRRFRDRDYEPEIEFSPAEDARSTIAVLGGGAYLGTTENGEWVTAEKESAVMVLGPPRSGKTSAVMIPAILGARGPVVATSTKPDVMSATRRARAELGDVWLFDPAGELSDPSKGKSELPEGVRELRWSPVAAAATWDQALVMARAMTACTRVGKGTTNETHWTERAAALLAPLLYAAHLTKKPIEEVLRWTLRQDMSKALEVLADQGHEIAADVLVGIERTDARERSSIFSATAGVLAAYNADATRATATDPNFDPQAFAEGTDTIYITAPEHKQAQCAPLIVGLLEQIRHATYQYAAYQQQHPGPDVIPRMLWALDEVANIAPIHDLPALVSQAGGQKLQVMIGLQDLSQARTRWGDAAADGFMSLFQTRLVLNGIADSRTLESISLALGEYDRKLVTSSTGTSESDEWLRPQGHNESVNYQTQRQRTLTPGEIAQLPDGHGLLLRGAAWGLIRLTPWYEHEPWASIANTPS
jgi:type IV secretory pathway TraG/TraD family ATPase VirD4